MPYILLDCDNYLHERGSRKLHKIKPFPKRRRILDSSETQIAFSIEEITLGAVLFILLGTNSGISHSQSTKTTSPILASLNITWPIRCLGELENVGIVPNCKADPIPCHNIGQGLIVCRRTSEVDAIYESTGSSMNLRPSIETHLPYCG